MHLTKKSVAELWCWVTAHQYEQQISLGVVALTQTCCDPDLHSSTDQWRIDSTKTSVAVLWCWITAHQYEQQISPGKLQ